MTIPYVTELFGGAVQVFAPEFYSEFETDPTFTVQVDLRDLLPSLADVPLGNHTLTAILLGGLTAEEQASIAIDTETSHTVVYAATEAALDPVLLQIQVLVDIYEGDYTARPARPHYVRGGYA
jgi:hypothetical protein